MINEVLKLQSRQGSKMITKKLRIWFHGSIIIIFPNDPFN